MARYYSKRRKAYFTKKLNEARRGTFGRVKLKRKKKFSEYSDYRRTSWGYWAPTKQHFFVKARLQQPVRKITTRLSFA